MLGVGRLIVLCPEGQMEFALPQVILLGMVPQPCQFQAEVRLSIPQVDDAFRSPTGSRPRASL